MASRGQGARGARVGVWGGGFEPPLKSHLLVGDPQLSDVGVPGGLGLVPAVTRLLAALRVLWLLWGVPSLWGHQGEGGAEGGSGGASLTRGGRLLLRQLLLCLLGVGGGLPCQLPPLGEQLGGTGG